MLLNSWRIELLGRLWIGQEDQSIVRFRTRKAAGLLAYLAFYRTRGRAREVLMDRFWPDVDPPAARMSLRTALASLRRVLEPPGVASGSVLVANGDTVRLNPDAFTTDVQDFEAAIRSARASASDPDRIRLLTLAVDLYRGELLPGFYDDWVLAERERLGADLIGALRGLVDAYQANGDLPSAIQCAHRIVRQNPLDELGQRSLMMLYAAAGQPGAAVRQFRDYATVLREQLDAEPAPTIRVLASGWRAAYETSVSTLPALQSSTGEAEKPEPVLPNTSPPAPAGVPDDDSNLATAARLPLQFTRFFGREEEIALLTDLLAGRPAHGSAPVKNRLITLTGPGGSGKTRLAITVAANLLPRFEGSVWFVALAELVDARHIPAQILLSLNHKADPARASLDQVAELLSRRACVLVLDNLEQLGEPGSLMVKTLLVRIPTLTCLVTSRHLLDLEYERAFPVLPLPVPMHADTPERLLDFASVQLFRDRAQAARPDFQVTARNATAVATVCERLEGIPLALELAASWSLTLTPAQLLSRLDRRFDLLKSRYIGMAPRQRTLRAAIDWSYELLSPELQRLFTRLSIFRGGWTLEAAEVICAEEASDGSSTFECLSALHARSLVSSVATGHNGALRFRMLDSLREYAAERLGDAEQRSLHRQHAVWFAQMAETMAAAAYPTEETLAMFDPVHEQDNCRAALTWSLTEPTEPEIALRLSAALAPFWWCQGQWIEGPEWLDRAIANGSDAPSIPLANALTWAAKLAFYRRDYSASRRLFTEAMAVYERLGDQNQIANIQGHLGVVEVVDGNLDRARDLLEFRLARSRISGSHRDLAGSLGNLGEVECRRGEFERAKTLFQETVDVGCASGCVSDIAMGLQGLGGVFRRTGDLAASRQLFEESLRLFRKVPEKPRIAELLVALGRVACDQADYLAAWCYYREAIALWRELSSQEAIREVVEYCAELALQQNRADLAILLLAALRFHGSSPIAREDLESRAREALTASEFEVARALGSTLSLEQVEELCMECA